MPKPRETRLVKIDCRTGQVWLFVRRPKTPPEMVESAWIDPYPQPEDIRAQLEAFRTTVPAA
jgi:hypothetical protein